MRGEPQIVVLHARNPDAEVAALPVVHRLGEGPNGLGGPAEFGASGVGFPLDGRAVGVAGAPEALGEVVPDGSTGRPGPCAA